MPPHRPRVLGAVAAHGVALDARRWTATLDGRELDLTSTEFLLLFALLLHPGWALDRTELADVLYPDQGTSVGERTIDSHIKNLRKKCRTIRPTGTVIRTVRGIGYKINGTS